MPKPISSKKAATLASLSLLTGLSLCGTVWQLRRYKSSKARWEQINRLMADFSPIPLADKSASMSFKKPRG